MRRRARIGGRLSLAGLATALAPAAARAQDDAFAEIHEQVRARRDLQFDFAALEVEPPPEPPAWLAAFFEFIAPFINLIFWIAVGLGVALILYFLLRELIHVRWFKRRGAAREKVEVQHYQPSPERARTLLEEADRLAAAGRFAEAARHLLHRSIQDIEDHRNAPLSLAMTSREISRLEALSLQGRAAFKVIAEAVEHGVFAAQPVHAEDYQTCRRAYASFALPEAWA
ncbi:MAG: hypothetical protein PVI23_02715 [Maricaulaceae bacterium]